MRETAELALAGRDVPLLVVPELNDPRYGEFEGGSLDEYREWVVRRGPARRAARAARARGEIASRYARGFRALLERPEETIARRRALAADRVPARRALEGTPPRARGRWSSTRGRSRLDARRARAGGRRARGVGRGARLLGHTDSDAGAHRGAHPRARPDRAGRRGHRASSPAAPTRPASGTRSASSATASRRSTSHHGLRGAESDEDARFCREALGAEVVAGSTRAVRPRPSCATLRYSVATDRLRATGHTASDQVETVLLGLVALGRAAADQGEARGRRRPAAARRSGARRPRPTAASAGCRTATTRRTRTRSAA